MIAGGRNVVEKRPETVRKFIKALVEGIHAYKTDREFGLRVLRKYLKTNDQEVIGETYDFYSSKLASKPYPTVKGMQVVLNDLGPESKGQRRADLSTCKLRFPQRIRRRRIH